MQLTLAKLLQYLHTSIVGLFFRQCSTSTDRARGQNGKCMCVFSYQLIMTAQHASSDHILLASSFYISSGDTVYRWSCHFTWMMIYIGQLSSPCPNYSLITPSHPIQPLNLFDVIKLSLVPLPCGLGLALPCLAYIIPSCQRNGRSCRWMDRGTAHALIVGER